MRIIPLTLVQANDLVARWHRHHKPVQGHRFSIGCEHNGHLCGAAIVGRPVARLTDQYMVIDVARLVTDGTKNACSFLYAAAARIAREMGFREIQTFILDEETGVSLKAAGWEYVGLSTGGDGWQSRNKRRADQPIAPKKKYRKVLHTNPQTVQQLLVA
jgi:hypothetical protein